MRAGLERDWALARFAERQHGHVTRRQGLAAGLGPGAIQGRIDRYWLHPVHRGVYRVGHTAPLDFDREMAAVLACGTRSVLSHASAAYVWALAPRPAEDAHVTGPPARRRRPGIQMHRSPLSPADVTRRAGIPITKPVRTMLDLAAGASPLILERAVEDGLRRGLFTRRLLRKEVATRRPGAAALRALLEREEGPALTRSEAEQRLTGLIRRAALPAPDHNVLLEGSEVDMYWPDHGLVVEIDGYAFHSGRAAFERDRQRDAKVVARGIRVMRVTWRQIVHEPAAVVARLAAALAGENLRRAGTTRLRF